VVRVAEGVSGDLGDEIELEESNEGPVQCADNDEQ
jgi:hypothetical protein